MEEIKGGFMGKREAERRITVMVDWKEPRVDEDCRAKREDVGGGKESHFGCLELENTLFCQNCQMLIFFCQRGLYIASWAKNKEYKFIIYKAQRITNFRIKIDI